MSPETILAWAFVAVVVAVVLWQGAGRERCINRERHAWQVERQELLTRIQAPGYVPTPLPLVPPSDLFAKAADDPGEDSDDDQYDLVGRVRQDVE